MSRMDIKDRYRGCLLGLACGDAIGTSVEFKQRGSFQKVTDMVGGGPFNLEPGQWTDDTSMALCLAESLVTKKKHDPVDQLNRYVLWADTGYLSCTGECFDIGGITATSLKKFKEFGTPYCGSADPETADNACIMRLAPVVMFFYPDLKAILRYAASSSRTTHGALECLEACRVLAAVLYNAFEGKLKDSILGLQDIPAEMLEITSERIQSIADCEYLGKKDHEIRTRPYVVETLEAALWCFSRTETFKDAVLLAANLGFDADTVASVCGQVAGAFYGVSSIPGEWLQKLAMRDYIIEMADTLLSTEAIRESYL